MINIRISQTYITKIAVAIYVQDWATAITVADLSVRPAHRNLICGRSELGHSNAIAIAI